MSEELKLNDIADVVKGAVEAKADTAALEAVKSAVEAMEIPSIEGLAKSEELEAAKAESAELKTKFEELEAVVKAAPAIVKSEEKSMDDMLKFDNYEGITGKASINFEKAFTGTGTTAQVTGAPTDMMRLYHQMQQRNPMRGVSTMMPISAGSVELPQVTAITAASEATLTTLPANPGGNLASVNVRPQNWVSRSQYTDQSIEDLPGLDQMVASFMAQAIARAEAADMVAQLNAATISEVNTGVATGNPTSINAYADLVAGLDSAYKDGGKFVMSRRAASDLRKINTSSTGGDLVIDPSSGMLQLWGYDVVINDHFNDGTTAGDNSVYFGDFQAGTVIVSRKELNLSRHEDTVPGAMYYYGNMRSRGVVWDANALVRFNTAA